MVWQQILNAIKEVGFPIFIALYFIIEFNKNLKRHTIIIASLETVIKKMNSQLNLFKEELNLLREELSKIKDKIKI